jgi:hypothetical protein
MPTFPDNPVGSLKPLLAMSLALLLTPGMVVFGTLCLLSPIDFTQAFTRLLAAGNSPEMMVAASLTVVIGMTAYSSIALLTQRKPLLIDMFTIGLSQVLSWLASISGLVHNPQEEYCEGSLLGSALAKAYQLDSCSLTINFWKQVAIGGFVLAIFLVLSLYFGRAFIRGVSQENKG